jgi:tRNA 2-thiouridine synthesizing protein A
VDSDGPRRYRASMTWDEDLDCRGLLCPLPVLRARKRLIAMASGAVLRVTATDPMAQIDLPHFCTEAGHEFLAAAEDGAVALRSHEQPRSRSRAPFRTDPGLRAYARRSLHSGLTRHCGTIPHMVDESVA